ncbi:MAG: FkbM family methyltransferase [Gemmatimonadota bacterium]|nr:FkbM family methyltransferase [Gemmatimonadota bacterium]
MSLGSLVFDASASCSRALPHFRGKWQVVDRLRRLLLPLRGAADPLCTVRMKDGSLMTWDLRDADEGRAVWLGIWDDAIRDGVATLLAPNAVILDVGASVGAWTVPLARRFGAGRVFSFEPVPANRARLERAIAANALANVTVSPLALGDAEREVDMWLRSSNTGAGSGTAAVVATGKGHLTVVMRPLDRWAEAAGLERFDFMKLDVEGAELMVLGGAEQTIARFRPLILAEFEPYWMSTHGLSVADGARWAASHDYRMRGWNRRAGRWEDAAEPDGEATLLVPAERA